MHTIENRARMSADVPGLSPACLFEGSMRLPARSTPHSARVLAAVLLLGAAAAVVLAPPAARAAAAATAVTKAAGPAAGPVELVPWDTKGDFAAALARAKKAKKPVFIDFYATWCGPCKMMDRQTYSDSTVGAAAAKYINRKVDAEKGEGISLARRYDVNSYPTMVLTDATGKELNRLSGFRPAAEFARFLDDTREGRGTIDGLEKLIAGGQDTYLNRVALGEKYAARGEGAPARTQFDRAIALDPADSGGRAAGLLLSIAAGHRAQKANAEAVVDYRRFLELFPASNRVVEARSGLAVSLAESGQPDEAFIVYKKMSDERPDDAAVQSGLARFAAALKVGLDEGLAAGLRAVELSQGSANAYDALAEVRAARGEWDEAVVAAEKAVEVRPSDSYLRGRLEKFQEGAVENVRNRGK
jgi:thioredoxin-like negative regulator of GroEL